MKREKYQIISRIQSFKHAFVGIWTVLKTQQNAWIHLVASILVIFIGLYLRINKMEWCCLILATIAVWTSEALNTALEFLADMASPDFHPLIKKAKDVAAGAVLISAFGAVIIGLLILWPYIVRR